MIYWPKFIFCQFYFCKYLWIVIIWLFGLSKTLNPNYSPSIAKNNAWSEITQFGTILFLISQKVIFFSKMIYVTFLSLNVTLWNRYFLRVPFTFKLSTVQCYWQRPTFSLSVLVAKPRHANIFFCFLFVVCLCKRCLKDSLVQKIHSCVIRLS